MGVLHLVSVGVLLVLVANVTWGLGFVSLSLLMDQILCIFFIFYCQKFKLNFVHCASLSFALSFFFFHFYLVILNMF